MSTSQAGAASWIHIGSGTLEADIDPLGAQLSVLRDTAGNDLLWHGDPAVWAGRAPLLFPIVGALAGGQYRQGGRSFALGRHGFARNRSFALRAAAPDQATFHLVADDASLAVYPFRFDLQVRFVMQGPTLSVTMQVRNDGDADMPASMGYHPGFRWPLSPGGDRAAHCIEFEADEPAPVRRIDAQGLLRAEPHATPVANRRLQLGDDLFRDDVLIFDPVRSRSVTYGAPGGPRLGIGFPDARYLGVWTKPGAPFVCIEPWQGITDPAGFSGELRDKPGVFVLAPGAARELTMTVTLL